MNDNQSKLDMLQQCVSTFRNLAANQLVKAREEPRSSVKQVYTQYAIRLNTMADFLEDKQAPLIEKEDFSKTEMSRALAVLDAVKNAVVEVEEKLREMSLV